MEWLPVRGKRLTTRPIACDWGRTAYSCLCVAALLAFVGSTTGAAQTPNEVQAWPSGQHQGSAVGDPEQGQRVAEDKCVACHGVDGNSPDPQFPKLAAQNPAYLYWQLWAFKRGSRKSDVMPGVVATLSDADMANVASFYSQRPRKPDTPKDAHLAAIGERVFFNGMPSCAMCHSSGGRPSMPMMGMMGRGMMGMMGSGTADVPNLNGQHASYVTDQLNRFARGERQGTVMNRIAPTLSETNREAVAEFLASTP